MSNYSFTDHKGNRVNKGDKIKVYRAPAGLNEWVGFTGVLMSIVLPGPDKQVMVSRISGVPKSWTNKGMIYFPYEYLEKVS